MTETQTTIERRGMRDVRTAVTARIRSKPTIQGQRYLDLYVLQRDRFRWLRLMDQAQRSILSIDMALRKLGFNPESGEQDHSAGAAGPVAHGTGKTIDLGTVTKRKRSA
jgi:hypothetical protein